MTRQPADQAGPTANAIEALRDALAELGRELVIEFKAMYLPRLKPAPVPPAPRYVLDGRLPDIPPLGPLRVYTSADSAVRAIVEYDMMHDDASCQVCRNLAQYNQHQGDK